MHVNNKLTLSCFYIFYLDDITKATLSDVLQFITGLRKIPPLGFNRKITLQCLRRGLPEASTCFHILYVPTELRTKEIFFDKFDQAVLYSLNHFGLH